MLVAVPCIEPVAKVGQHISNSRSAWESAQHLFYASVMRGVCDLDWWHAGHGNTTCAPLCYVSWAPALQQPFPAPPPAH